MAAEHERFTPNDQGAFAGSPGSRRANQAKASRVSSDFGLLSSAKRDALTNPVAIRESAAISALVTNSALRLSSSVELGWRNFAVERRTILPGENPERILDRHFLLLWDAHVAEGETLGRGGRFVPYKKYPNTMTTCLPGIRPAYRRANKHEVIVGALGADFVDGLEAELDARPSGSFQTLYGTDDPELRNLLLLLLRESEIRRTWRKPLRRTR